MQSRLRICPSLFWFGLTVALAVLAEQLREGLQQGTLPVRGLARELFDLQQLVQRQQQRPALPHPLVEQAALHLRIHHCRVQVWPHLPKLRQKLREKILMGRPCAALRQQLAKRWQQENAATGLVAVAHAVPAPAQLADAVEVGGNIAVVRREGYPHLAALPGARAECLAQGVHLLANVIQPLQVTVMFNGERAAQPQRIPPYP